MKRLQQFLFATLFFAFPVWAADPPPPPEGPPAIVELSPVATPPAPPAPAPDTPYTLSAERFRWFTCRGTTGPITWEVEPLGVIGISEITAVTKLFGKVEGALKPDFFDLPVGAVVTWPAAGDGTVKLSAFGVVGGKAKRLASIKIQVGPPTPPIPPPGPTPPVPPSPTPPSPIPADGLHVLIVFDRLQVKNLPAKQQLILTSQAVRDYMTAKCVKGPDGKTSEWRIWASTDDASNETKLWQDAFGRPRQSLPWIIISNPQTRGGFEGPLPATIEDTMTLLRQYGG